MRRGVELIGVFDSPPLYLSDDKSLVGWLRGEGCRAHELSEIEDVSPQTRNNLVFIPCDYELIPSTQEFLKAFGRSRVLFVPVASFGSTLETATYSLNLLWESDFDLAVDANVRWLKRLVTRSEPFSLTGNGTGLSLQIAGDVHVMRPKTDIGLLLGEWVGLAGYFEVGMVMLAGDDYKPAYDVSGSLRVEGVAIAAHRQMPKQLWRIHRESWTYFDGLRKEGYFPLDLEIQGSIVVRASADGKDILKDLVRFTNKQDGLVLAEMAFGTNESLDPSTLNWEFNSQMNEGAAGIHVGIGDGLTGVHIDFVAPGVELS